MTKQSNAVIYRQGDVWIYRISNDEYADAQRSGFEQVDPEKGLILAEGEATGHHHRIPVEDAKRALLSPTRNPGQERVLAISGRKPVSLVHEEHETIKLPPGKYAVRIQREYTPTERTRQTYVRD